MAKIVISYNIPIPKAQDHELRFSSCKRYPFEEMKKGGSFFVKDRSSHQLAAAALCWSRRNGGTIKFTVRQKTNGARIWRIK